MAEVHHASWHALRLRKGQSRKNFRVTHGAESKRSAAQYSYVSRAAEMFAAAASATLYLDPPTPKENP